MIIVLDAGNTRIKWGVHDGVAWVASGAVPTADLAQLNACVAEWPSGARVILCNVAGAVVANRIEVIVAARGCTLSHFRSSAEFGGVKSSYDQPTQLGADRWAAMVGARSLSTVSMLVVCAGTATTIDQLNRDGCFLGGLILPGIDLMRSALAKNTAQLPLADGGFNETPCNTMDAIISGCLAAQLGAIERSFSRLADQPGSVCLLTGGAAPLLLPHLRVPVRHEPHLIFVGLMRYAAAL